MLRIQEQGCAVCTYKFNTFLQKKKKRRRKKGAVWARSEEKEKY
jgi:hypothetical protein